MRISDMINFTRAFDSAWERMVVILFRPFDLGKWFVIGFGAFLAGLLSGGNGFSGSYRGNNTGNWSSSYSSNFSGNFSNNLSGNLSNNLNQFNTQVSSALSGLQTGAMIFFIALAVILILGFVLLLYWLGARGQFLLLDNVVRNRGAVAWPWRAYARQGNSLFLFYLLYLLLTLVVIIPATVVGVVAALPLIRAHRWPEGGEVPAFILLGLVFLALLLAISVVLFLFRELGVPLMFRNGLLARPAFVEMWRLVTRHPGPIVLFVLLRIALFVALFVVSIIACCVTCCIGLVPYLGTVVLLPALLFIKCFTLDFLAQFGPEYDVWTVDVPPSVAPTLPPPHE